MLDYKSEFSRQGTLELDIKRRVAHSLVLEPSLQKSRSVAGMVRASSTTAKDRVAKEQVRGGV